MLLIGLPFASCSGDTEDPITVTPPTNLEVTVEIVGATAAKPYGDGSGRVHLHAKANNALSYAFTHNNEVKNASDGKASYTFGETGTYLVTVDALGEDQTSVSKDVELEVQVAQPLPDEVTQMLTGDGSRTWRIQNETYGHFGLGPVEGAQNQYYAAGPDEKSGTGMYDDRYIFNRDGTFTHITDHTNDTAGNNPEGTVFGRINLINELAGSGSGTQEGNDITNYPLEDYQATWSLNDSNGEETIAFSGTAFIGYYTGGDHHYQIVSRTEDRMVLKTTDGNGEFDWWFTLIATDASGGNGENAFTELIWSQEFDIDGVPDPEVWNYELGDGCPNLCGWGNNEQQWYTDKPENVQVTDGILRITAMAETVQSKDYSSARITTKGKFEFTYGKVEVRAKLPEGGGTWPAIWMLGGDIATNPWPGAGEIDIMEHKGNDPNVISAATHDPVNYGGNARSHTTTITNASTEFHVYSLVWTAESLDFLVDDNLFFSAPNNSSLPYNKDFYLLLNVAMGGTFGGNIDPGFVSSSMEIDYIRVYQ